MSSRRRPRPRLSLLLSAGLLALAACKDKDKEPSTEALELIPADMHGVFGRSADDAPGLKVGPTGLEFRTMKLTIHEGKMEGSTVRIERATLAWEKLEPKTCTGTISRQGDHLLLSLFDANHPEDKCESILDAQWEAWTELDEIPELMRGRYGALLVEPRAMRLDLDWVSSSLEAGTIWQLPGTNDERVELLVDMATVTRENLDGETETFKCDGELGLVDNKLDARFFLPPSLEPAPGSDAAKDEALMAKLEVNREACEAWRGQADKYTVSLDDLPKQPIATEGGLTLTIAEHEVVLDSAHMRCAQELWKTETVDSRAGWSGAQFGGEAMTLGRAEPSGVSEDCKLKIRIYCEAQAGTAPGNIDTDAEPSEGVQICMDETERGLCPERITVREISNTRFAVNLEPQWLNLVACVDPTAEFQLQP